MLFDAVYRDLFYIEMFTFIIFKSIIYNTSCSMEAFAQYCIYSYSTLQLPTDVAVGAVECSTLDNDRFSSEQHSYCKHINLPCLWTIRHTIMTYPVAQSAALRH